MTILDIQKAFAARGYTLDLDGVWGRQSIAVTKSFQAKSGLKADGIVGPQTIAALNETPIVGRSGSRVPILPLTTPPVWHLELGRRLGLNETKTKTTLINWLRSDGKTIGDPSVFPWCGDAIQTALALTLPDEVLPANPYLARNWLKVGNRLVTPAEGAIGVFWRGSRTGIEGHVATYCGERRSDGAFRIRGGNQTNSLCETWIGKDRLLGWQWPSTVPLPSGGRTFLAADGGALSLNEA